MDRSSDLDLLEKLLAGPRRASRRKLQFLLEACGSRLGIFQIDREAARAHGLSDTDTASLLAAIELIKRFRPLPCCQEILRNPEAAALYLYPRHASPSQEVVGALFFDARGRSVGEVVLFRGTLFSCTVGYRPILVEAVRRNAASLVLFHNHPSGDPMPSEHDVAF